MLVHLIRHGAVRNPDGVVYGRLPGFPLSEEGRRQASRAADRLAGRPLVAVYTSPLERAVATAREVAARHGLEPQAREDLLEWEVPSHWVGTPWSDLPQEELDEYLHHPLRSSFPEDLESLARRLAGAVREAHARHPEGEVAVVGHQDPLQAARLALTGRDLSLLHEIPKPGHGAVVSLHPGDPWGEVAHWEPTPAAAR